MTPEQFKAKYNEVKDLIKGHGAEIANEAGLSYSTYFNVIRGMSNDPGKIDAVWTAIRSKVEELLSGINDL